MRHGAAAIPVMTQVTTFQVDELEVTRREPRTLTFAPLADSGPAVTERLRRMFALRAELERAGAVRPIALHEDDGRLSLVCVDPGGTLLSELARDAPLPIGLLLEVGLATAHALARFHACGLVHRDLNPGNVWVSAGAGEAWLAGTGLTIRLARMQAERDPPDVVLGTLAYMAPEQTGRLNRSIDSRSDLYALGAILYELATAKRPFVAKSVAGLLHAHVAREPVPPTVLRAELPAVLSRIIEKLLSKSAEARYQTASGLAADLERCLDAWRARSGVEDFPLCGRDRAPRPTRPDRLIGREAETERLREAFERSATGADVELVLVRGWSGVGKSSLVRALQRFVASRGRFCSGKFDARRSERPYATLIDCLDELARPVLCLPGPELAPWRDAILEAVGPDIALVAALVPDLELIVGPQPSVAGSDAKEAQRRLHRALAAFLGVFASAGRPLLVFLDDLQWHDAATLELVEFIVVESNVKYLLLVGAYRDNEVATSHPLRKSIARMLASRARVSEVEVTPLGLEHTIELLGETLQEPAATLRPFAELVFAKTHGNPFFALQLVTSLVEDDLLTASPESGWQWSLDAIRARRLTDDVATLVTARITRLSPAARRLLECLACLDGAADGATLALLCEAPSAVIASSLEEVAAAGLVEVTTAGSRFAHDRVSEAAYALVPADEREAAHLDVARKLLRSHGPEVPDDAVFTVASQYNRARRLLASPGERTRAAELDLAAARRARHATAYASSLAYASAGLELLGDDVKDVPALAFALGLLQAECRFLTGDLAGATRELAAMSRTATGPIDLAAVTCLQIDLHTAVDRSDLAVEVALHYLASVGIAWSAHPPRKSLDEEYGHFHRALVAGGIESFAALPLMLDPAVQATMDVLTRLQVPAMFSDENLGGMVLARMANLSIAHGNCHGSCFACAWLAGFAGAHLLDADSARKLVDLAVRLVERPALGRYRARVLCLHGYLVTPWIDDLHAGRARLVQANAAARADGDLTFVSYTANHLVTVALGTGVALDEAELEIERGRELASKARFGLVADFYTGQLRLVRSLRGKEPAFVPAPGSGETEKEFEVRIQNEPLRAIAACWYWIRKLQAHYFAGELDAAEQSAARASTLLWTSTADFEIAEYHFFAALTHAARARVDAPERRASSLVTARLHHDRVAGWAAGCPETFRHRQVLLRAELAFAEGETTEASRAHDEAIRLAEEGGFPHDAALALALASRHRAAVGETELASAYRRRADEGYARWGATSLVMEAPPPGAHDEGLAAPSGWSVEELDLATVIAVAQSVSSEIEVDQLLQTIVRAAAEHAGAQRVVLALATGEDLRIVAETVPGSDGAQVEIGSKPIADAGVPTAMFRYVARTKQPVNLASAAHRALFVPEPGSRSILCLPLLVRASLVGVLYLEHASVADAFSPKRIPIVRLLASQAAAAIENARLYAAVKDENAERRRAEAMLAGEKEILHHIASDRSLPDVMEALCALARRLEPGWSVEVVLHSPGADALRASAGHPREGDARWVVPIASVTDIALGSFAVSASPDERRTTQRADLMDRITQLAAFAVEHARKRDELLVSEERFRQFADALPEVVWITDLAPERVVYCSPSFEAIWGYTVDQLYAEPRLWTDAIHPEDRPRVDEMFGRWIHGAEAKYEGVEFRIIRPDGEIRWIREIGVVSKNRNGVPYRVGGIASDVTAQKVADEAQLRAQAELAHLNRVATMGELTASIAHEVSQPLAAIVTSAGAGARWLRATPPDVEQARETLARIARDGSRATEVITRLRALFQKTDLAREAFSVIAVIRDVEALVGRDLGRRRIRLECGGSGPDAIVSGSRVQIQQVLLNLVLNAVEAIDAGDGVDPAIAILASSGPAGFVEISVRDTGVGLAAMPSARLFEAFYTTKPRGMGMGLSVVRSIVQAHGGRIDARANEGRGATFTFTLPEVRSEA